MANPLLGSGIVPGGAQGAELTATTRRSYIPRAIVQFGSSTPTISAALANAQMASGGISSVTAPVQGSAMTTAQATDFGGGFNQPSNLTGISEADYNLKCIIVPIQFLGMEGLLQLSAAIVPLIEARMNDAGNQLTKYASTKMWNNAADQSIDIDGMPLIASATGTYGNINRATSTWWQANIIAAGASPNNNRSSWLNYVINAEVFNGGEMPNIAVVGPGTWTKLAQDFVGQEQYNITPGNYFSDATQGAGSAFRALMVAGVPVYMDPYLSGALEGTAYLFNTRYISFYIHEAAAFAFTGFASTLPTYTLGYVGCLVAVLELVCVKPASVTKVTGLDFLTGFSPSL